MEKTNGLAHNNWKFLTNQFWSATRGNYSLFYRLSKDHAAKLEGAKGESTELNDIYKAYRPLHNRFEQQFEQLGQFRNERAKMAETMRVELINFKKAYPFWKSKVRAIFLDSPVYKHLFPKGLKPFNSGKREGRIKAVKILARDMVRYKELDKLRPEVERMGKTLDDLHIELQQLERRIRTAVVNLGDAHFKAASRMHVNAALLVANYDGYSFAANFFDLGLVRNTKRKSAALTEETTGVEKSSLPIEEAAMPSVPKEEMTDTAATMKVSVPAFSFSDSSNGNGHT